MGANPGFWWFDGGTFHLNAPLYANLRGITLNEAIVELSELLAKLAPAIPVDVEE